MEHIKQISEQLAASGVEGLLIFSSVNLRYATGRDLFAGAVLVTADAGWYLTPAPSFDSSEALTVRSTDGKSVVEAAGALIRSLGLKNVGVEESSLSWDLYTQLAAALPCPIAPAQDVLTRARTKKTPDEIELIRAVQAITDDAFEQILPELHAGLTEHDVAGLLAHRMLSNGGFTLAFPPIVASGPNGANPHGFATDRVICKGDFVTMDFGCVMNGYGSDMTRTVAIGEPTGQMREVYNVVLAAQKAGMAAAHAGVAGREIDAAGRKVIAAAGYGEYFTHGFGHGLGIEGHENPGAGPNDTVPLPAGAVVSAEPGIYIPGRFGVRIENLIVLTETGCEDLNRTERELIVL